MESTESQSERLRRSDPSAFTSMVREHEHDLLKIAFRITGHVEDAEEVRQEVLTKVWQQPATIPDEAHLAAWLRRCTINAAIDKLRSRNQPSSNQDIQGTAQVDTSINAIDDHDLLNHALEKLPPDKRALLSLRFDLQLTLREIASTLDKPHTTIQAQLDQALARLRTLLNVQVAGEKP